MSNLANPIERGGLVNWTYQHCIGRTWFSRTKRGLFCGLVKHASGYRGDQMALVMFEGNKRVSRVPVKELQVSQ